jgi:hypothetical protein
MRLYTKISTLNKILAQISLNHTTKKDYRPVIFFTALQDAFSRIFNLRDFILPLRKREDGLHLARISIVPPQVL